MAGWEGHRASPKASCGRWMARTPPLDAMLEVCTSLREESGRTDLPNDAEGLRRALLQNERNVMRTLWEKPKHAAYLAYEGVRKLCGEGCMYVETHVAHGDAVARRNVSETRARLAVVLAATQQASSTAWIAQHVRMVVHMEGCRTYKEMLRLCDALVELAHQGVVGVGIQLVTTRGETYVRIGNKSKMRIAGNRFSQLLRKIRLAGLWIALVVDLSAAEARSVEVAVRFMRPKRILLRPGSEEAFAKLKDEKTGTQLKGTIVANDLLVQVLFDPTPFLDHAEPVDGRTASESSGEHSEISAESSDYLLGKWKADVAGAALGAKSALTSAAQQVKEHTVGKFATTTGGDDLESNLSPEEKLQQMLANHPLLQLLHDPAPGLARCIVIDVDDPGFVGCELADAIAILVTRAHIPPVAFKVMMLKLMERASTTYAQKQQIISYTTIQYLGSALPRSPWAADIAVSARKVLRLLDAQHFKPTTLAVFMQHQYPNVLMRYQNERRTKSDASDIASSRTSLTMHFSSSSSFEYHRTSNNPLRELWKNFLVAPAQHIASICTEVVEPQSTRANVYFAVLSVLILLCTVVDPLLFGYACGMPQPGCQAGWFSAKVVLECCYAMCMLYTFNVGYLRKEEDGRPSTAMNREEIAMHYLGGWFAADLLSVTVYFVCIPLYNSSDACKDWSTSGGSSEYPISGYTSMCSSSGPCCEAASWVEFVPLLSLLRLLRLLWMEIPLFMKQTYWYVLCIILFAFFLTAHVVGASWIFISRQLDWVYGCIVTEGVFEGDGKMFSVGEVIPKQYVNPLSNDCPGNTTSVCGESGILNPWLQFQGLGKIYLAGTYFGFHTVANFGPENIPCTTGEMMLSFMSVIIGLASFALIIGEIDSIVREKNKINVWFREKLDETHKFIDRHKLSPDLSQRILHYIEEGWRRNRGMEDRNLLESLSATLRRDVQLCLHRRMVADVPFFRQCSTEFVDAVCEKLVAGWCPPNEILIHKGSIGMEMYFLHEGEVEVSADSEMTHVFARMRGGSFFGELALLHEGGLLRTASIRSTTYCEYATLRKGDLDQLLLRFPREKKMLWRMSQQRKARSDQMEAEEAARARAAIICQRAVRQYRMRKLLDVRDTSSTSGSKA